MRAKDIATALSIPSGSIGTTLTRMADKQLVISVGNEGDVALRSEPTVRAPTAEAVTP